MAKAGTARTALRRARHEVGEATRLGIAVSTPERLVKSGESIVYIDPEPGDDSRRQRVSQVPLDRLRAKKLIDGAMFEAGDRYRMDAYMAGVIPSISIPTEPGRSSPMPSLYLKGGEKRANAYKNWSDAACALGPELQGFADEFLVVAECHDTMEDIGARVFGRSSKHAGAIATEVAKLVLHRLMRFYDRGT